MEKQDKTFLKGNILIVDDTPANLRLLSYLLSEAGHTVRAVTSGARAIEAVEANLPDLILLDVNMPKMSGYEVCEQLKTNPQTRDIPVIFISALGNTEDKLRAFTAGGVDYITKPFQVKEVIARVTTHLALRDLQKRMEATNQLLAHRLEELSESNAALQAHNAELDAFSHTVAHDLKNPLTYLRSYGELLRDEHETLSPEEFQRCTQGVVDGANKIELIIDNLLLLASVRKMDIDMQPLDMAEIIEEALMRLTKMIEEYEADIIKPETWPVALGYAPWVEQIWINYISNALKYGGQPPYVELGVDTNTDKDGWIRFWVRDNGEGISPEDQNRLFTPFERLHQVNVKGYGLGLSIVQRIAQKLCGGVVGVESTPGQGSTFYFTLPTSESDCNGRH